MAAPRMGSLDDLHARLAARARRPRRRRYRLPALWNCWGYEEVDHVGPGQIAVDPIRYALACLEHVVLPARGKRRPSGRSLSRIRGVRRLDGGKVLLDGQRRRGGDWIQQASLYSTLIRTTTAWDHNGNGRLTSTAAGTDTGTFLKTILLLPLLLRTGVDTLYMLPISKCSRMFRKGEVGCPYSAKNFYELEPDLHDRLLGTDAADVEMEFAALVEAAHALDMRVMIDLAPRTASRDADLIIDHPEWFYWIDRRAARRYGAPQIDGFTDLIPQPSQLGDLFCRKELRTHLAAFRQAPSVTEPVRWRRFADQCRSSPPRNLLKEIGREFGVITPPGFSDCINDPQPPWSDVTFLRLYLDHPSASAKHLPDAAAQPPYVFTDTIKSSRFPGRRPNRALWRTLADILPFYQRFGVDGARVDMGHALPPDLQDMIVNKPRRTDPDFAFLAEEFDHGAAPAAKRAGYNAIIGSCWYMEPRAAEGELHKLVREVLPQSALPALAAAETPDTPRAVTRPGGVTFARMAAVLNHFLPSGIPLINSGLEVSERQPMNLGLDSEPSGRFALPRSDPFYGKLAYFDRTALHWQNAEGGELVALLGQTAQVRRSFLRDLSQPRNYFEPHLATSVPATLAVGWRVDRGRQVLLVVANTDFRRRRRCVIDHLPRPADRKRPCDVLLEFTRGRQSPLLSAGKLRLALAPGEVKVLTYKTSPK